jgi:hypothetical protein
MSQARASRRGGALAVLLGALAAGAAPGVACDDAYEAPCRVARSSAAVSDPALDLGASITRSRDRAIATWIVPGDAADAGLLGLSTIDAFEVSVVDASGALVRRATVPAPPSLRARLGGVVDPGVVVEDGAFLVHWIEATTATDASGFVRTIEEVKLARVRDGAATPIDVADLACERCTTSVAGAALGGDSIVIVRTDPDRRGLAFGAYAPPTFRVLRVAADGVVTSPPAPWLGLPSQDVGPTAPPSSAVSLDVDADGALVVRTGGVAWRVGPMLDVLAGPVILPRAADAKVAWSDRGEASVLWTVSPSEEGRAVAPNVPRDLFSGRAPVGAGAVTTRARASAGALAVAIDRRGDEVGALFESGGRTLFVELDPDGTKHGGDLSLGSRRTASSIGGRTEAFSPTVLFARGGRRFTAVSLGGGELAVTEVACAR